MTRIGTFAANNLALQMNMNTQVRIQDARIQISSGMKSQSHDGIAQNGDARRLEGLKTEHSANAAFSRAIERTELRLQEMESSVRELQEIASRYQSFLLQAANGDNAAASNIEEIADEYREQVAALLNTELEGRFLFGGSRTDVAPIDKDNLDGAYYRGNTDTLTVRADTSVEIAYGVTADPNEPTGFDDLIQSLNIVADGAPVTNDDLDDALDLVKTSIDRLADTASGLGTSQEILERTRERLDDNQVQVEGGIGDVRDIDIAKVMTQLSHDQSALEASYAVTARLNQVSLLNFLR